MANSDDDCVSEMVLVFCGENSRFPIGVFRSRPAAEAWIARHQLSGILTRYPVDVGVYEWAVQNGTFVPKCPEHESARFIAGFTSASLEHTHFLNGAAVP